jgi:hypothetical protein
MLDERQYRSPQACPQPGQRGANRVSECAKLWLEELTKLGARQEAWLDARLATSKARWNLLAQGTVMAYVDETAGPGERFWTDSWNGYPAARRRLLDTPVARREQSSCPEWRSTPSGGDQSTPRRPHFVAGRGERVHDDLHQLAGRFAEGYRRA